MGTTTGLEAHGDILFHQIVGARDVQVDVGALEHLRHCTLLSTRPRPHHHVGRWRAEEDADDLRAERSTDDTVPAKVARSQL